MFNNNNNNNNIDLKSNIQQSSMFCYDFPTPTPTPVFLHNLKLQYHLVLSSFQCHQAHNWCQTTNDLTFSNILLSKWKS